MKVSRFVSASILCIAALPCFASGDDDGQKGIDPDFKCRIIYVPTEEAVVEKMLQNLGGRLE